MVASSQGPSSGLIEKIKEVLSLGWIDVPPEFGGDGAPGNTLEFILNVATNNQDLPDLGGWELKYHGGRSSLLTLFHKDPEPRGILKKVVNEFGWPNDRGNISFRHTIKGQSERGFKVINQDNRITVSNNMNEEIEPYWSHNTLIGQMAGKLRRLILVNGNTKRKERKVQYISAIAYWDVNLIGFCEAVENGTIYVDFDARTSGKRGTALRNHGTKFRIRPKDLKHIYENYQIIIPD